jgi:pyruvate decarboxylase
MVTTGGVGEVSAINTHAGAFVEHSSIVHIVGTPALRLREIRDFSLHHTLGHGKFDCFSKMFTSISTAQVFLYDASQAPDQIDYALKTCWVSSRPVYIEIPSDMAQQSVDGARLAQPLDLSYPQNDKETESIVLSQIQDLLRKAARPCVLVDMCATRQKVGHGYLSSDPLQRRHTNIINNR